MKQSTREGAVMWAITATIVLLFATVMLAPSVPPDGQVRVSTGEDASEDSPPVLSLRSSYMVHPSDGVVPLGLLDTVDLTAQSVYGAIVSGERSSSQGLATLWMGVEALDGPLNGRAPKVEYLVEGEEKTLQFDSGKGSFSLLWDASKSATVEVPLWISFPQAGSYRLSFWAEDATVDKGSPVQLHVTVQPKAEKIVPTITPPAPETPRTPVNHTPPAYTPPEPPPVNDTPVNTTPPASEPIVPPPTPSPEPGNNTLPTSPSDDRPEGDGSDEDSDDGREGDED